MWNFAKKVLGLSVQSSSTTAPKKRTWGRPESKFNLGDQVCHVLDKVAVGIVYDKVWRTGFKEPQWAYKIRVKKDGMVTTLSKHGYNDYWAECELEPVMLPF